MIGKTISHYFIVEKLGEGMFGRVLGTQPVLGRAFRTEEHGADGTRTVIISDAFWDEHFARDPGVLGRSVPLNEMFPDAPARDAA